MGEKLVIGPISKGLSKYFTPFMIDNDSFPTLFNAYQWRGRIKRKRGTSPLVRLTRYFDSTNPSYTNSGYTAMHTAFTITLSSGAGNLLTGPYTNGADTPSLSVSLQTNGNIVPGSVIITDTNSATTYTDPSKNGTLTGGAGGTINYATGAFTITGGGSDTVTAKFLYYPDLPVMGLEDLILASSQFPGNLGFDTTYSYNITTTPSAMVYDVSFYKNPSTQSWAGYTAKTNVTPTSWNGHDYQQFNSVNYQGAFWVTNGIDVSFTGSTIGMQFAPAASITVVNRTSSTTVNFTITNCPLVVGDFVFANEFVASGGAANSQTLNFQTGCVTNISGSFASLTITVKFPNANIAADTYTPGILQYLTNRSNPSLDCLRWYDGDPTNGNATTPTLNGGFGWVNFMPPLSNFSFAIPNNGIPAQYYLVGARVIFPFKDRLLFFGVVIQTSTGASMYLQDTVVYSEVGTPYYTASFQGSPINPTNLLPMLVPSNQSAFPAAFFADQSGFGGNITAGVQQAITTVAPNEDALIVGFNRNLQTRFIYSGLDLVPFNFFIVNAELPSANTFSTIVLDMGVMTYGGRGFIITSQTECKRFDLEIPDQVFEIDLQNNGTERVTAQRDFINEWIYFSYPSNESAYVFPNETLQYNYRDNSWAIFIENYTTYGQLTPHTGDTWATIGNQFPTWSQWTEPWSAGSTTILQPKVIAGNQQGFVLIRDTGTAEANSLEITNFIFPATITGATQANPCVLTANNSFLLNQKILITGVVGMTQLNGNIYTITTVTPTTITINVDSTAFTAYSSGGTATPETNIYSPNHCLNDGDYIVINGVIGSIASAINGNIFQVSNPDTNTFFVSLPVSSGTYFGGGLIKRMYIPFVQTKQFPVAWSAARKTRIGPQQYLLSTTAQGQITLLIFLSQDAANAYNDTTEIANNSIIYSTVLYTCPESTNLGLTAANTNLQMLTASTQQQIWHRMNTSLLGDTIQIGFTMSDAQMTDPNFNNQFAEIELHSIILDVNPSMVLA